MRHAISKHVGDFVALLALFAVSIGVSYYIVQHQRLRIPYLEKKPFQLKGEFATGQAITPGQGQTVRLSGVRVGDIAKVELSNGRAIVTMDLDRKYEGLVHENWSALLRPKTGLKDMFIELIPGKTAAPAAEEGWVMPIASTLPDVNPDEFLSSLDKDTRDYLVLLLEGARGGLTGRADDLNAVLKRFEPTYRDLAAVSSEVAKRRTDLKHLVRSLNVLYTELGSADDDLAELVGSSAVVFDAFARERDNVQATVHELPSTLATMTDALGRVDRMAQVLGPASERLRPAVRALGRANVATRPFALEAAPLLRTQIRPFVREARPLIRNLTPAAHDLVVAEPALKRSVHQLNRLFNLLAFNDKGRQGPEVADRDEGYLFYLAWLAHQSVTLFGGQDAHGVFRPFVLGGTCNTLKTTLDTAGEEAGFLQGVFGALYDSNVCGGILG